jgi:HAD superfamily hydrolase (TIGR01509 family)
MSGIRGVILDVDGTLVDSNDAHAWVWVEAFKLNNHGVSFEEARHLIGMGSDKLIPELSGIEKESEEGQQIAETHRELFKTRYLPTLQAFPKVPALLAQMQASGLKLVAASSAEREELDKLLEIAGATKYVQAEVSSDEAESSKPDPDSVQAALRKMGFAPDEVIMVGDTPYDIEAAGRVGMGVIALRCGGWRDQDLKGALAIYDDPADLLAHYKTSPLAGVNGDEG